MLIHEQMQQVNFPKFSVYCLVTAEWGTEVQHLPLVVTEEAKWVPAPMTYCKV